MSPARSHSFFFNDTATTEIYTLSLHDALPIYALEARRLQDYEASLTDLFEKIVLATGNETRLLKRFAPEDRKSTRLNSSHANISYAVFCLKKIDLALRRVERT